MRPFPQLVDTWNGHMFFMKIGTILSCFPCFVKANRFVFKEKRPPEGASFYSNISAHFFKCSVIFRCWGQTDSHCRQPIQSEAR